VPETAGRAKMAAAWSCYLVPIPFFLSSPSLPCLSDSLGRRRGCPEDLSTWTPRQCLKNIRLKNDFNVLSY
jgi:hypothetical protein